VPHTLSHTIMEHYREGTRVHLEVDLVARYLERLLLGERAADPTVAFDVTRAPSTDLADGAR